MRQRATIRRTADYFFTWEQAQSMNINFARAMIGARARGEEHFVIGVLIDHRPMHLTHFERVPTLSFMSSSAGACADAPGAENLPERMIPSMGGRTFR